MQSGLGEIGRGKEREMEPGADAMFLLFLFNFCK